MVSSRRGAWVVGATARTGYFLTSYSASITSSLPWPLRRRDRRPRPPRRRRPSAGPAGAGPWPATPVAALRPPAGWPARPRRVITSLTFVDGGLHRRPVCLRQLVGVVPEQLLHLVDHLVGLVAGVDQLAFARSSSAWASASLRIRSTSVRAQAAGASMRTFCSLPVPRSLAD